MKIVIEIDDDYYQFIKDTEFENYEITKHLYEAVYKGTPLPKGYDRLIDVGKLLDENADTFLLLTKTKIRIAPTIIEIEAESEDNE